MNSNDNAFTTSTDLISLMTEQERQTLLSKGINYLANGQTGKSFIANLKQCKRVCPISGKTIMSFLYAPLETLNLHSSILQAIKKYTQFTHVYQLYQARTTQQSLLSIPNIAEARATSLHKALKDRKLPGLAYCNPLERKQFFGQMRYGSLAALYAFFDPIIGSIVTPREAYLLQAIEWGYNDKCKVADIAKLVAPGQIGPILRKIKHSLGRRFSDTYTYCI